MDTSSSIEPVKNKPGPKPAPKVDTKALENRIHNLEQLIVRMAHNSGTSHIIIKKAGLVPYTPTSGDMSKFVAV